ncbi:hypothetical protein CC86DRAFT_386506 [Ophiobolus disseminans]|uniref:Uncharacterized protein n=1 Tax=Ophiobolus disseminans TaxID=1469910 RepID=A0A6A6ZMS8_9PLEO|nr:hypothetical protein CC86DRAFT_386506 [Ophiobolus disseminans]
MLQYDATRATEKPTFVKTHEDLLQSLLTGLKNDNGRTPSETSAIGFLAKETRRELISSEIYDLAAPSDNSMREKIHNQQEKDRPGLYMIARWLAEQDKILLNLASTAEFLVTGQPFEQYKQGLRELLVATTTQIQAQQSRMLKTSQELAEKVVADGSEFGHSQVDDIDEVEARSFAIPADTIDTDGADRKKAGMSLLCVLRSRRIRIKMPCLTRTSDPSTQVYLC